MKHILFITLALISYIGIGISFLWAVVEFILYLVKDTVFNWWSVWIIIICVLCAIIFATLTVVVKDNFKLPKPNKMSKSRFAQRLEEMEKQRNNNK